MMSIGGGGGGGFTTSQWAELEHQALIFKYITAGVPVPPDLLLPIRSSFDAIQSPFYRHSSLGYYSYYGKKLDPEPWRCRRTDGKKWRCAKEAYPDSKYCERHMHRGRNRSRKPVESHSSLSVTKTQTPISSSPPLLTSAPALNANARFQVQPLSSAPALTNPAGLCLLGPTTSPYLNNRYCSNNAVKAESGERHLYSEPSGSSFAYGSNYSLMGSSSYPSLYLNDPLRHEEDLGQVVTISSLPKDQHKHSFNGFGFGLDEPVKAENQLLRPFFDEWPKNKGDSWSDLEDHRSNANSSSFSTTRLSISIPNDD